MSTRDLKIPKIVWVILILLGILQLFIIGVAIHEPSGRSYPRQVETIKADIDYDKINEMIKKQLASLPTPQNGSNGTSIVGATGAKGTSIKGDTGSQGANVTTDQIADAVAKYFLVNPPPAGEIGVAGKTPEIRYNFAKAQLELRYEGDFTWTPLVSACTLTNTCGS